MQSRPIEFKNRGTTTISAANEFLQSYRFLYNEKFSVEPEGTSLFVPMTKDLNIDEILCIKHDRKTDNTGTFSFKNRCFQILEQGFPIISAMKTLQVLMNPRFGIKVSYKEKSYDVIRYLKPQRTNANVTKGLKKAKKVVLPHLVHSSRK